MRVAIVGSRGIPANYGGFETFAQELGLRLVERGHEVTVYCRSTSYKGNRDKAWNGIRRIVVPTPRGKHRETVVSSLFAMLDVAVRRTADVVILVNGINAFAAWIPRVRGIKVYINVDGIERQRAKWGRLAKSAYFASEYLAKHTATGIISDAEVVAEYYRSRHGVESTVIGYGAPVQRVARTDILAPWGIEPGRFVLYVSRLEPENNAHTVIEAYADVRTNLPLIIVGDAPYADEYKRKLRALANEDDRVQLVGGVYDAGYRALQESAAVYVQATSVGGTHPALVEAMGAGNAILANDTPEHREVLVDAGRYYSGSRQLSAALQLLLDTPDERERLGLAAQEQVLERFSWDAVTTAYEHLLLSTSLAR